MNRVVYRLILGAIFILGCAEIVVPIQLGWTWDRGLLLEFGKAFVIAGILGFTIEPWMRKALARDVFSAAFGYYMPNDFKAEIARITSGRKICIKHIMDVKIEEIDQNSVRITLLVERHFTNIGVWPVLHRAMIWVDEWGYPEPSEIIRCEIFNEKGNRSKKFNPRNIDRKENLSMKVESPPMCMFPNSTLNTIVEYKVIRQKNDQFIEIFMTPTRDPEIRITQRPPNFEVSAGFGGDDQLKYTNIPDRYVLDGVYFPPAIMKIRWFPKAELANWVRQASSGVASSARS
jgi:hypothetical protein